MENRFRIPAAGLLAAVLLLAAGPSWGRTLPPVSQVCGKFVMKLEQFGKLKLRDYNSYVPEIYQVNPGSRIKPSVTMFFRVDGTFTMGIPIPNQKGVLVTSVVPGTYTQKGKRGQKLKLKLTPAGETALETAFGTLSKNDLFGSRELVTAIPYVNFKPGSLKFKGRLDKNGRIRLKFKTRLEYDIQFMNDSEVPDTFGADGVFKLRSSTKDCTD